MESLLAFRWDSDVVFDRGLLGKSKAKRKEKSETVEKKTPGA